MNVHGSDEGRRGGVSLGRYGCGTPGQNLWDTPALNSANSICVMASMWSRGWENLLVPRSTSPDTPVGAGRGRTGLRQSGEALVCCVSGESEDWNVYPVRKSC